MYDRFAVSYQHDGCGPNAMQIRASAMRVINGPLFGQVRKELFSAVKSGHLGRLKKDGLKPEIFFHPDHKKSAIERQNREAAYSIGCIASVMYIKPVEQRIEEALASLQATT